MGIEDNDSDYLLIKRELTRRERESPTGACLLLIDVMRYHFVELMKYRGVSDEEMLSKFMCSDSSADARTDLHGKFVLF